MAQPNILLIHCHDLGDMIGCYRGNGAQTPHLDEFAAEGAVFDRHFAAAPTCSPSRASMMTGLYPHRHGLMGLATKGIWPLSPQVPTLPGILRKAGYYTACFGVWHVSADPSEFGIQHVHPPDDCQRLASAVVEHLRQHRQKPFFLSVGFREPHRPFTDRWPSLQNPGEVVVPPYLEKGPRVREDLSYFHGDVSRMDAAAGLLFQGLRQLRLEEDTLVVFTADHGIAMPLAKGTLYDPGLKIAMVARWPGRIGPHRRCIEMTGNIDLLPTLLDAAGLGGRIPDGIDGKSLWPWLSGDRAGGHDRLFAEQTWHDFYEPMRAIRTGRHKLIRNFMPGTGLQVAADILRSQAVLDMQERLLSWDRPMVELYDLAHDPHERHNLADDPAHAGVRFHLLDQLYAWLRETDDPIIRGPVPAPGGYLAYFMAKWEGPGGLPIVQQDPRWMAMRLAPEAMRPPG